MKFDPAQLYEERVLVFIEDIDEGVFRQVLLDTDQFKQVSDAIIYEIEEKEGDQELVQIAIGEEEIPSDTFIGMESVVE